MTCEIGRNPTACTSANSSTDRSEVKKPDADLPISPRRCWARSGNAPCASASSDAACSVCARDIASRSCSLPRRKKGIRPSALQELFECVPCLLAGLRFVRKFAQKRIDPDVERYSRALQHDAAHGGRAPRLDLALPRRQQVARLAQIELDRGDVFLLRQQPRRTPLNLHTARQRPVEPVGEHIDEYPQVT